MPSKRKKGRKRLSHAKVIRMVNLALFQHVLWWDPPKWAESEVEKVGREEAVVLRTHDQKFVIRVREVRKCRRG